MSTTQRGQRVLYVGVLVLLGIVAWYTFTLTSSSTVTFSSTTTTLTKRRLGQETLFRELDMVSMNDDDSVPIHDDILGDENDDGDGDFVDDDEIKDDDSTGTTEVNTKKETEPKSSTTVSSTTIQEPTKVARTVEKTTTTTTTTVAPVAAPHEMQHNGAWGEDIMMDVMEGGGGAQFVAVQATEEPTKPPRNKQKDEKTDVPATTTTTEEGEAPTKPPRKKRTDAPVEITSAPTKGPTKSPTKPPTTTITTTTSSPTSTPTTAPPSENNNDKGGSLPPVGEAEVYHALDDDPIVEKDEEIVEHVEDELAKQEKVARTAGGFGFVLAICAMIFTAHQMSENPDGIFASICRLAITLATVVVKIICMPCRKIIGTGHPHYTGHMPISTSDYRYRGADSGFEMT